MFYYLYKITNLVNNKIYVGVHKTNNMNDGYMGSGKIITRAIEKYGIDNFQKEILYIFDNENDMYAKEKEIVTEEFLKRNDVYNLRRGGSGGFDYINKLNINNSTKTIEQLSRGGRTVKQKMDSDINYREKLKITRSLAMKQSYKSGRIISGCFGDSSIRMEMTKRSQTPEIWKKRMETRKQNNFQVGKNNSQYGTTWIWHELFGNKKIKKICCLNI